MVGLVFILMFSGCSFKKSYDGSYQTQDKSTVVKEKAKKDIEVGTIFKDVVYKSVDDGDLKLDLYTPLKVIHNPSPVVVYIHGGSWFSGDKSIPHNLEPVINQVRESGYTVISIEYRLVNDKVKYPIPVTDTKDSLRWIYKNADKFNLDLSNIGIIGVSAGAHLAMLSAYSGNNEFLGSEELKNYSSKVKYVVDFSGPTTFYGLDNKITNTSVENLMGDLAKDEAKLKEASPINYINSKFPTTLIVHGSKDDIVPLKQSQDFYSKAKSSGANVEMIIVDKGDHDMSGASAMDILNTLKNVFEFITKNTN